jgi:hypothetical protein
VKLLATLPSRLSKHKNVLQEFLAVNIVGISNKRKYYALNKNRLPKKTPNLFSFDIRRIYSPPLRLLHETRNRECVVNVVKTRL